MATIVRALALVGLAGIVGVAHSMTRDRPIRLDRARLAAPPATGDPANAGDPAPDDPGAQPAGYDPAAIDTMTPEELLDAAVLEGMITLREAAELHESGALFLDARHEEDFLAGHIEGALWLPASEVLVRAEDLLAYDPTTPVVIYCTGGECDASHNTANRLLQYGPDLGLDFADVRIMGLGYDEWSRAGLPVSSDGAEGDG